MIPSISKPCQEKVLNSLPNDNFSDLTKFKALPDDK